MNVREVVEVILAVNGGKKLDKTCDQLIEATANIRSGMKEMATWLQPLLGEIPVYFSDAGEPFIYL